jgi:hypothetical protein
VKLSKDELLRMVQVMRVQLDRIKEDLKTERIVTAEQRQWLRLIALTRPLLNSKHFQLKLLEKETAEKEEKEAELRGAQAMSSQHPTSPGGGLVAGAAGAGAGAGAAGAQVPGSRNSAAGGGLPQPHTPPIGPSAPLSGSSVLGLGPAAVVPGMGPTSPLNAMSPTGGGGGATAARTTTRGVGVGMGIGQSGLGVSGPGGSSNGIGFSAAGAGAAAAGGSSVLGSSAGAGSVGVVVGGVAVPHHRTGTLLHDLEPGFEEIAHHPATLEMLKDLMLHHQTLESLSFYLDVQAYKALDKVKRYTHTIHAHTHSHARPSFDRAMRGS